MSESNLEQDLNMINDSLSSVLSGFSGTLGKENPLSKYYLDEQDYNYLYERARIFQNIVNLIPEDGNLEYPKVKSKSESINTDDLQTAIESIPAKGEPLEPIDLKGAALLAGIYARLYGDGFIFMGIRDGRDPSQPVDWDNVQGIDWVVVRSKYEVSVNISRDTITNYGSGVNISDIVKNEGSDENIRGVSFHTSRVNRMKGVSRHGTSLHKDHFNMSVIDGVYSDYKRYLSAIKSSAEMLESHSTFKFGISGLSAKVTKSSVATGLKNRFKNILEGMRIIGGVLYDKDKEQADYITRSYSGVKDILEHLKDWLVGNSGLPQNKLFGSAASNALSSQSEGEKEQWAEIIDRYRATDILPFYQIILKILVVSQGLDSSDVKLYFPSYYQRTDKEIAETEKIKAETLKIQIDSYIQAREAGLMTDEEIRDRMEVFHSN